MVSGDEALERLRAGNLRFAAGKTARCASQARDKLPELRKRQFPFAVILSCSDSRIPTEIVFDQCLGDLFVVRVAGNVAGHEQTASIELVVDQCSPQLILVMGHRLCGAIDAMIQSEQGADLSATPALGRLLGRIAEVANNLPAVSNLETPESFALRVVRANTLNSARSLIEESPLIGKRVANSGLRIVAAEFSFDSGEVEYFDLEGQRL